MACSSSVWREMSVESLVEVRAEVARVYRGFLPGRLSGLSVVEQEVLFDRLADQVMEQVDELVPEMRAAAIAEEVRRTGRHPDYLETVAIGRTARAAAIERVLGEVLYSLID